MAHSSSTLVSDTTLWVDLRHGQVLRQAFLLPYAWVAPDLVVAELQEPPASELAQLGLRSCELSGAQVSQIVELASAYRAVSTADLAALVLAQAKRAVLVTGDKHLRRAAQCEGVPVHGTLWVLDEMVRLATVAAPAAALALEAMLRAGSRLPEHECRQRLLCWCRQ